MPQRLADEFELVEHLDRPQDVGRVRTLAAACFEPAAFLAALEHGIQQDLFHTALHESRPKLTEHRVMKALVAQLQTQRVLPVNAGAYGLCRLPVAQV